MIAASRAAERLAQARSRVTRVPYLGFQYTGLARLATSEVLASRGRAGYPKSGARVPSGAMRRSIVLMGLALTVAASLATVGAASTGAPTLRSVTDDKGHLIVLFTLPRDTVPGSILVATSRAALSAPLSNASVKLHEAMHPSPAVATGVERWRTRKSLPAGTYYVEVSAVEAVGITDCVPRRVDCLTRWSGARRIVVP